MKTVFTSIMLLAAASTSFAQPPDSLWSRTYGGSSADQFHCVRQTIDGGYILAGSTYSFGGGLSDFWLVRTDAQGNVQWSRTFGGSYWERCYSVRQTSDGGFILAGQTGNVTYSGWLVKTDAQGITEWSRTLGPELSSKLHSVEQTADGGYILGGNTGSLGDPLTDFVLIKTNPQGYTEWSRSFGGTGNDFCFCAKQTSDGGYVLAGSSATNGPFWLIKTDSGGNMTWNRGFLASVDDYSHHCIEQTTDGGYVLAGSSNFSPGDFWVAKTNEQGSLQWSQTYGGVDLDRCYSVHRTVDGGYVLGGHTASYGAGSYDMWAVKIDAEGNLRWTRTFGGASTEWCFDVQPTTDGGYVLAGSTQSFGGADAWLVRMGPDPSLIWIEPFEAVQVYDNYYQVCPGANKLRFRTWVDNGTSQSLQNIVFSFTLNGQAPSALPVQPQSIAPHTAGRYEAVFDNVEASLQNVPLTFFISSINGQPRSITRSTTITSYGAARNNGADPYRLCRDSYEFANQAGLPSYQFVVDQLRGSACPNALQHALLIYQLFWGAPGLCFGMAATSGVYFEHPDLLPDNAETAWELARQDPGVEAGILWYHAWYNTLRAVLGSGPEEVGLAWGRIESMLAQRHPAILVLKDPGNLVPRRHAVLAYQSVYDVQSEKGWIYCYDNALSSPSSGREALATYVMDPANMRFSFLGSGTYAIPGSMSPTPLPNLCTLLNDLQALLAQGLRGRLADFFGLACPARPLVTDEQGRQLGYVNGADFVNEIPEATLTVMGTGVDGDSLMTCFIPSTLQYSLQIFGLDTGSMDFEWARALDSTSLMPFVYRNLPVSATLTADFDVSDTSQFLLSVDFDGDGTVDSMTAPTSDGLLYLVNPAQPDTPVVVWDAGVVECPDSASVTFTLKNSGAGNAVVFAPFVTSGQDFAVQSDCPNRFVLTPDQMAYTITLTFAPQSEGVHLDTLRIWTNARNNEVGFIRIPLTGAQTRTPVSPQVVIAINGEDASLHWNRTTESIGGCLVNVTRYLVFYSPTTGGQYYYHGGTADTTYTHTWAVTYVPRAFYHVIASTAPLMLLEQLPAPGQNPPVSEEQVLRILRQQGACAARP